MSTDLVVKSPLNTTAQTVQDQDLNNSLLALSTTTVQIGPAVEMPKTAPPFNGPFSVSGSEPTANGLGASITISNDAPAGANWYLRAGATGTGTPAGGMSIANDATYAISITPEGQVGIINNNPQATLDVSGTANVSGALSCGSLSLKLTGPPSTVQVANLRVVVVDVSTGTLYYV